MPVTCRDVGTDDILQNPNLLRRVMRANGEVAYIYNDREFFDSSEYLYDRDATRLTRDRPGWFDFRRVTPVGERIMPRGHEYEVTVTDIIPVGVPHDVHARVQERIAEMNAELVRQAAQILQHGMDRYAPSMWRPTGPSLNSFISPTARNPRVTYSARAPERVADRPPRPSDFDMAWVERTMQGKSNFLKMLYGDYGKKKVDYSKTSVIYTEPVGPKAPHSDKFLKDEFPVMFKEAYGLVEGPN